MDIKYKDLFADVTVECRVGEIMLPDKGSSFIGYLKAKGEYKYGSSGAPDANHICGTLAHALHVHPYTYYSHWIIDLSELSYTWGNDMEEVLFSMPFPEVEKFAFVIGPKCKAGISTLIDLEKEENVFERLEDAVAFLAGKQG